MSGCLTLKALRSNRNGQLRPHGPVLGGSRARGGELRRARDDAHVGEGVPDDDRQPAVELPVGIGRE